MRALTHTQRHRNYPRQQIYCQCCVWRSVISLSLALFIIHIYCQCVILLLAVLGHSITSFLSDPYVLRDIIEKKKHKTQQENVHVSFIAIASYTRVFCVNPRVIDREKEVNGFGWNTVVSEHLLLKLMTHKLWINIIAHSNNICSFLLVLLPPHNSASQLSNCVISFIIWHAYAVYIYIFIRSRYTHCTLASHMAIGCFSSFGKRWLQPVWTWQTRFISHQRWQWPI